MKITTDTVFNKVEVLDTGQTIKITSTEWVTLMMNILNDTQFDLLCNADRTFTLSKKAERFLRDFCNKINQPIQ